MTVCDYTEVSAKGATYSGDATVGDNATGTEDKAVSKCAGTSAENVAKIKAYDLVSISVG